MTPLARLDPPLRVVLVEPQIPPNTGNVARMCAVTGSELHLVAPLGFVITDRHLKRAGLDYWDKVHAATWPSFDDWMTHEPDGRFWLFSAKAERSMWDADFRPGDWLVFGPEQKGLPPAILARFPERTLAVPMVSGVRSLNLATCAGIAVYEALRQIACGR